LRMKKTVVLSEERDLGVDLTFHNVSASLLTEFAEKIVRPYFNGNLNAAIRDLSKKHSQNKTSFAPTLPTLECEKL